MKKLSSTNARWVYLVLFIAAISYVNYCALQFNTHYLTAHSQQITASAM